MPLSMCARHETYLDRHDRGQPDRTPTAAVEPVLVLFQKRGLAETRNTRSRSPNTYTRPGRRTGQGAPSSCRNFSLQLGLNAGFNRLISKILYQTLCLL